MKAEMDERGTITLKAETSVEAYALKNWVTQNFRQLALVNPETGERAYWRCGGLVVKSTAQE